MTIYNFNNFHPSTSSIPNHVGIIPDGTRRWSDNRNIELTQGYIQAMDKLFEISHFIYAKGTSNISIYLSSVQNFRRSKSEIDSFCFASNYFLEEILARRFSDDVKVHIVGNKNFFPDYMLKNIRKIEDRKVVVPNKNIFLCLAYNPFDEVFDALEKSKFKKDFLNYLSVNIPLDLVIRTSGANLLSNFLLIQAGYARLYNINKLFNDTKLSDYESIFNEFMGIDRKYGD